MSGMITRDLDIIDWLLTKRAAIDTTPIPSIKAWKYNHDTYTHIWPVPIDRAIAGGFLADRVAYAFAAGYNAALQKLFPNLPMEAISAICVTEKHGGHPAAITTRIEKKHNQQDTKQIWQLSGFKQFVTSAEDVTHFLVAASAGIGENGLNRIRLVCIEHNADGLLVKPMDNPLPFIPEIRMGTMQMENVSVTDTHILPGDGYHDYVKPFRTIEDIYITGAMMGYIYRISSLFEWPRMINERLFSMIAAVKALSMMKPNISHGHIVLEGVFVQMEQFFHDIEPLWGKLPGDTRAMWYRDRVIINRSDKVRAKRLANAWRHYGYNTY